MEGSSYKLEGETAGRLMGNLEGHSTVECLSLPRTLHFQIGSEMYY